jgi:hypothetical protein
MRPITVVGVLLIVGPSTAEQLKGEGWNVDAGFEPVFWRALVRSGSQTHE